MSAPDADRNSRSVSTESAALRVWTRVLVRVCGNVRYQATVGRRYDEALSWLNKGLDFAHALESTSALFFAQTNPGARPPLP
jgi:hypothetical protein